MVEIYTDGGYSIPRGVGGYGVVIVENNQVVTTLSEKITNATSNVAELKALLKALDISFERYKYKRVVIFSDSQYCVRGFNSWLKGWDMNNFTKHNGEEVKNKDLWVSIKEMKEKLPLLKVEWVKGHNDNKYNELADSLTKF